MRSQVDSGFYGQLFVGVVMLPTAGGLLVAALGNALRRRWGRPLHLVGIISAAIVGGVAVLAWLG